MKIQSHFDHDNFNVTDLDRSIDFYRGAVGPGKDRRDKPDSENQ